MNNTYNRLLELVLNDGRTDEVSQAWAAHAIKKRTKEDEPKEKRASELKKIADYHDDEGGLGTNPKTTKALRGRAAIQNVLAKSGEKQARVARKMSSRKTTGAFTDPEDERPATPNRKVPTFKPTR